MTKKRRELNVRPVDISPFDLRDGRAMVSLGPLSPKKYCSYSCPFCYVHADFRSYPSRSLNEIVIWLEEQTEPFDIIYVSGDTDSFAPPRTEKGLDLLESLTQFDRDVMFTTRYVFKDEQLIRLERLARSLKARGKLLFGCTSVCQLSHRHLEPPPIRPSLERIAQLGQFRELGMVSVLAMRPFLPVVSTDELVEIALRSKGGVHLILGETWYADQAGILEEGVFAGETGIIRPSFEIKKMDFDANEAEWRVFDSSAKERAVRTLCNEHAIPFFMRSRQSIEWARANLRF